MSNEKYAEVEAQVRAAMARDLPEWRPGWRQLPEPVTTKVPERIARFFKRVGVPVNHRDGTQEAVSDNAAFFNPVKDDITLPPVEAYESMETYAQAAFHETTHWSGHIYRLRRPFIPMEIAAHRGELPPAAALLARYHEEMIAEFGSLFLAAALGIKYDVERSAGYIRDYNKPFRPDEREWVLANSIQEARKATEWLLERNVTRKEGT